MRQLPPQSHTCASGLSPQHWSPGLQIQTITVWSSCSSLEPCECLLSSYCFRSTRTSQILFQPPTAAHCHSSTFSALHTPKDFSKTSSEEQCSSSHSFFQKCSILQPKSFPLKFCLSGKSLAQFHQGSPTESLPDDNEIPVPGTFTPKRISHTHSFVPYPHQHHVEL